MSKKKIPFYLVAVKTEDDRLYYQIDERLDPREANDSADREIRKICEQGQPIAEEQTIELHLVIEEWESEADYDNGTGSVTTIRDTAVLAKKNYAVENYDL